MIDVAYIALGSNVGDRAANLAFGRVAVAHLEQCRVLAESDVEETDALTLHGEAQDAYLNQVIAVETSLSPHELLAVLQRIERDAGRIRERRWGSRTLDLDIILFENQVARTADLTIPHPALADRPFWRRELDQVRIVR